MKKQSLAQTRETILILVVHGIGSNYENLKKNRREFVRALAFVKNYWFWEIKLRLRVEFIDWKSQALADQVNLLKKVVPWDSQLPERASWHSNPRRLINNSLSDFLFYMTPKYGDHIVSNAAQLLNACAARFQQKKKYNINKIFLVGHSLGCLILHEILTGQVLRPGSLELSHHGSVNNASIAPLNRESSPTTLDSSIQHNENTEKPTVTSLDKTRQLTFPVDGVFFLGSPLAAFYCLYESHYPKLMFPEKIPLYNIYHPHDPIAFRLESLFYTEVNPLPPSTTLPYWKNNGQRDYNPWNRHARDMQNVVSDYLSTVTTFAKDQVKKWFKASPSNHSPLRRVGLNNALQNQIVDLEITHDPCIGQVYIKKKDGLIEQQNEKISMTRHKSLNLEFDVDQSATITFPEAHQRAFTFGGETSFNPKSHCDIIDDASREAARNLLSDVPSEPSENIHYVKPIHVSNMELDESLNGHFMYQKINADIRYGMHDRKPRISGAQHIGVKTDLDSLNQYNFALSCSFLSGAQPKRTHGVTFPRLLKALGLNLQDKEVKKSIEAVLRQNSFSGIQGLRGVCDPMNPNQDALPLDSNANVLSEYECSGGLELPVRLDFELQELTVEHYVISLGQFLSHFNYWNSKDTAFFLLKQMTSFRPRVSYPDFVQLLKLSETLNPGLFQNTTDSSRCSSDDDADAVQRDSGPLQKESAYLTSPDITVFPQSKSFSRHGLNHGQQSLDRNKITGKSSCRSDTKAKTNMELLSFLN